MSRDRADTWLHFTDGDTEAYRGLTELSEQAGLPQSRGLASLEVIRPQGPSAHELWPPFQA